MATPTCPNCGSGTLYISEPLSAGGGYAPNYLPGLGGFFVAAKLELVLCGECGLTRFFASEEARSRIAGAKKWRRL